MAGREPLVSGGRSRTPGPTKHNMFRRREVEQVENDHPAGGVHRCEPQEVTERFRALTGLWERPHPSPRFSRRLLSSGFSLIQQLLESKGVFWIPGAGNRSHLVTEVARRNIRINRRADNDLAARQCAGSPACAGSQTGTIQLIQQ